MMAVYQKILVIAGSGIGDILLATPVMRSLRRAYPESIIDVLVPLGRGGVLEGNPDINEVITVSHGQGSRASVAFLKRLWRQYDIAFSTRAGDRSVFNAWCAAPVRHSFVRSGRGRDLWLKTAIQHRLPPYADTHAVLHALRLLDPLKIERHYTVVPPSRDPTVQATTDRLLPFSREHDRYMVVHPYPRNRYKCWPTDGWVTAIRHAAAGGLRVVMTGGDGTDEQDCICDILDSGAGEDTVDLSGKLTVRQVSDVLTDAALYLGPDTGITHLAAAHGIPCVALYGPTNPVYWGPWPHGYREDRPPFRAKGCQRQGNVTVLQCEDDCVACGQEGCANDPTKPSRCMEQLPAHLVLETMDEVTEWDTSHSDTPV